MARPRLPDAVKAQRGTLQLCRTNPAAPRPDRAVVPPPPRGLPADERRMWKELAAQVDHLGTYAHSDFTAFRLAVVAVAAALRPDPDLPAHVRVKMISAASAQLTRFGLDPASRSNVSAPPRQEDTAEGFLFAGSGEQ